MAASDELAERGDSFEPPNVDSAAVDRGVVALCRFVFPGAVVPRREMARAVLIAAAAGDEWPYHLPAKQTVYTGDRDD